MNGSGGVGEFGRGLELASWGASSAQFGDVSGANLDVSGTDPMSLYSRANHGSGVEFEGKQVCLIDDKL
jgi:hypothetical protein